MNGKNTTELNKDRLDIKIHATDLLNVLIEAGIDTVDAKAIVLDVYLLQQSAQPSSEQGPPASPERHRLKDARVKRKRQREVEYDYEDDDEEEVVAAAPEPKTANNRKKPKRVSFEAFGGTAPGLR